MRRITIVFTLICATGIILSAEEKSPRIKRDFFAFDNGMNQIESFDEKVKVLKELGYAGVNWRTGANAAGMIEALDKQGLKMVATYVCCKVDADNPSYPKQLAGEMDAYKKHNTIIWLNVSKGKNPTDEIAVKLINEIADLAEKAGLDVVLYPHLGCYVATVQDGLRLAKKVNRKNVGTSFNLCHFLKTDDEKNMGKVLKECAPYLKLVSINGADSGDTRKMKWNRLIQPLGSGSYDVSRVLAVLDEIGYKGPVGLQCYAVKGDNKTNLKKSAEAWNNLNK